MGKTHKHICVTRLGQEGYLCREVGDRLTSAQCTELAPRVVELSGISIDELTEYPLFFSSQLLPNAQQIAAPSIKTWSVAITEIVFSHFGDTPSPWCLHIFDPASAESGKMYARPTLIHEEVSSLLKQKRRGLLKTLQPTCTDDTTLVQVLTTSPTGGYISITPPTVLRTCGATVARHMAGYISIPDDKRPPSRAFKKLREAIDVFQLPLNPGDTAVDLGASPGGWTYVLLEYGLRVIAVDRSPLTPELSRRGNVTFVAGNAFTWRPEKPVDWLVCDVITTPSRTRAIIEEWVQKKSCKHLCVTVKFKGAPELTELRAIGEFLKSHARYFDGRQLTHNKNEVTVVATM